MDNSIWGYQGLLQKKKKDVELHESLREKSWEWHFMQLVWGKNEIDGGSGTYFKRFACCAYEFGYIFC